MNFRNEFAKRIEDIRLGPNTPKEEFESKTSPLLKFISDNLPEQLFKFRGCTEYSLDAFEKDELWLSKASLFNDLHDSLFFFDKDAILKSIDKMFSSGKIFSMIETIKQGQFSNSDFQNRVAEAFPQFDAQQLNNIALQSIPGFSALLD